MTIDFYKKRKIAFIAIAVIGILWLLYDIVFNFSQIGDRIIQIISHIALIVFGILSYKNFNNYLISIYENKITWNLPDDNGESVLNKNTIILRSWRGIEIINQDNKRVIKVNYLFDFESEFILEELIKYNYSDHKDLDNTAIA